MIICGDAMLMRRYYGLNMLRRCYVLRKESESMCGMGICICKSLLLQNF